MTKWNCAADVFLQQWNLQSYLKTFARFAGKMIEGKIDRHLIDNYLLFCYIIDEKGVLLSIICAHMGHFIISRSNNWCNEQHVQHIKLNQVSKSRNGKSASLLNYKFIDSWWYLFIWDFILQRLSNTNKIHLRLFSLLYYGHFIT